MRNQEKRIKPLSARIALKRLGNRCFIPAENFSRLIQRAEAKIARRKDAEVAWVQITSGMDISSSQAW